MRWLNKISLGRNIFKNEKEKILILFARNLSMKLAMKRKRVSQIYFKLYLLLMRVLTQIIIYSRPFSHFNKLTTLLTCIEIDTISVQDKTTSKVSSLIVSIQ